MKLFYQLLGLVLGFIIGILTATSSLAVLGLYIYSTDRKTKNIKRDYSGPKMNKQPNPFEHKYESRKEAEEVLDMLMQLITEEGFTTVSDLKIALGMSPTFADSKQGWKSLSGVTVSRVDNPGKAPTFLVNFPELINL